MASDPHQPYDDLPLADPSKQIRLLRILPAPPGSPNAMIECKLSVHELSQVAGQYGAISYTWGAETPTEDIIVDGVNRTVRWNCWYVLGQMRSHDLKMLYWIDSICISQENHHEKGEQIRLMSAIYSNPREALICLGQSGADQVLFRAAKPEKDDSESVHSDARLELSRRPYFQRLWTVQEYQLAPTERITVFSGTDQISWKLLKQRYKSAKPSTLFESGTFHVEDFLLGRVDDNGLYRGNDLWKVVGKYSDRRCFDPRDKVFGILALVDERQAAEIRIDYETSLLALLLNVAAVTAKARGDPSRSIKPLIDLVLEFAGACDGFRRDILLFFQHHRPDADAEATSNHCSCRPPFVLSRPWQENMADC